MFVKCRRRRRVIKITVVVVFVYTHRGNNQTFTKLFKFRERGDSGMFITLVPKVL